MYTRKQGEQQADIGLDLIGNFSGLDPWNRLTDRDLGIIFGLIRKNSLIRKLGYIVLSKFNSGELNLQCFANVIGGKAMPVYEYECQECDNVFEVQQKIADDPLSECPTCHAPVKKLMSMSSFQLKGGGWYADGYSSAANGTKKTDPAVTPAAKPAETAVPCNTGGSCAACPAATSA